MRTLASLIACLGFATTASATSADIVRYPLPNSDFPIAQAVEVPAGHATVYLSGVGPSVADASAAKDSLASFGDTRTQTLSALTSIQANLKRMHLDLRDVVKMQVFLVADPGKGGRLDFAGMMESYRKFFGTAEQPMLPARSAMQVAALANPGWLIEIEVTAVRP